MGTWRGHVDYQKGSLSLYRPPHNNIGELLCRSSVRQSEHLSVSASFLISNSSYGPLLTSTFRLYSISSWKWINKTCSDWPYLTSISVHKKLGECFEHNKCCLPPRVETIRSHMMCNLENALWHMQTARPRWACTSKQSGCSVFVDIYFVLCFQIA